MNLSITSPSSLRRIAALCALGLTGLVPLGLPPVLAQQSAPLPATSLVKDGDRIVFVGDSITGQGYNVGGGWAHQIAAALAKTHSGGAPKIVSLGGSGHTVGSWAGIAKRTKEQSQTLDVKQWDVKAELDQPAGVVVVMLGMNDVLSPSLNGDEASLTRWIGQYQDLATTLKERATPRVLAFATIPFCTEDKEGIKNRTIGAMNQKLRALAASMGAVVLPVHETMWDRLDEGRRLRPDYHLTGDMVHPNGHGHMAIAQGMLAGLGEAAAASEVGQGFTANITKAYAAKLPLLSYEVSYPTSPLSEDKQPVLIRYYYTPAAGEATDKITGKLTVPAGWSAPSGTWTGTRGEVSVTGPLDKLHNLITLECGTAKTTIDLPPAWLVGAAAGPKVGWNPSNTGYEPDKGVLPIDADLSQGKSFGAAVDLAPGKPLAWKRVNPSVNYLGGATNGSVDMNAATMGVVFETGYGARWIQSPDERVLKLKLNSRAFADGGFLTLWAGGQQVYAGHYAKDRNKVLEIPLKKGWNALTWKANHLQWQWHFSLDVEDGQNTDDLRFSTVPKQ